MKFIKNKKNLLKSRRFLKSQFNKVLNKNFRYRLNFVKDFTQYYFINRIIEKHFFKMFSFLNFSVKGQIYKINLQDKNQKFIRRSVRRLNFLRDDVEVVYDNFQYLLRRVIGSFVSSQHVFFINNYISQLFYSNLNLFFLRYFGSGIKDTILLDFLKKSFIFNDMLDVELYEFFICEKKIKEFAYNTQLRYNFNVKKLFNKSFLRKVRHFRKNHIKKRLLIFNNSYIKTTSLTNKFDIFFYKKLGFFFDVKLCFLFEKSFFLFFIYKIKYLSYSIYDKRVVLNYKFQPYFDQLNDFSVQDFFFSEKKESSLLFFSFNNLYLKYWIETRNFSFGKQVEDFKFEERFEDFYVQENDVFDCSFDLVNYDFMAEELDDDILFYYIHWLTSNYFLSFFKFFKFLFVFFFNQIFFFIFFKQMLYSNFFVTFVLQNNIIKSKFKRLFINKNFFKNKKGNYLTSKFFKKVQNKSRKRLNKIFNNKEINKNIRFFLRFFFRENKVLKLFLNKSNRKLFIVFDKFEKLQKKNLLQNKTKKQLKKKINFKRNYIKKNNVFRFGFGSFKFNTFNKKFKAFRGQTLSHIFLSIRFNYFYFIQSFYFRRFFIGLTLINQKIRKKKGKKKKVFRKIRFLSSFYFFFNLYLKCFLNRLLNNYILKIKSINSYETFKNLNCNYIFKRANSISIFRQIFVYNAFRKSFNLAMDINFRFPLNKKFFMTVNYDIFLYNIFSQLNIIKKHNNFNFFVNKFNLMFILLFDLFSFFYNYIITNVFTYVKYLFFFYFFLVFLKQSVSKNSIVYDNINFRKKVINSKFGLFFLISFSNFYFKDFVFWKKHLIFNQDIDSGNFISYFLKNDDENFIVLSKCSKLKIYLFSVLNSNFSVFFNFLYFKSFFFDLFHFNSFNSSFFSLLLNEFFDDEGDDITEFNDRFDIFYENKYYLLSNYEYFFFSKNLNLFLDYPINFNDKLYLEETLKNEELKSFSVFSFYDLKGYWKCKPLNFDILSMSIFFLFWLKNYFFYVQENEPDYTQNFSVSLMNFFYGLSEGDNVWSFDSLKFNVDFLDFFRNLMRIEKFSVDFLLSLPQRFSSFIKRNDLFYNFEGYSSVSREFYYQYVKEKNSTKFDLIIGKCLGLFFHKGFRNYYFIYDFGFRNYVSLPLLSALSFDFTTVECKIFRSRGDILKRNQIYYIDFFKSVLKDNSFKIFSAISKSSFNISFSNSFSQWSDFYVMQQPSWFTSKITYKKELLEDVFYINKALRAKTMFDSLYHQSFINEKNGLLGSFNFFKFSDYRLFSQGKTWSIHSLSNFFLKYYKIEFCKNSSVTVNPNLANVYFFRELIFKRFSLFFFGLVQIFKNFLISIRYKDFYFTFFFIFIFSCILRRYYLRLVHVKILT